VVGQCSFSRGLRPLRSSFVLRHSRPRLSHEASLHSTETLRASARSVALRLVADKISLSYLAMLSPRIKRALP
jgi:hypothetical protein